MRTKGLFLLLSLGSVAACVTASVPPEPPELTPEEIVRARQAAFHLSAIALGSMRAALESGGDVAAQAYAARGVARWAKALPTMFPDSTRGVGPTRARPEIWANKTDFEAKAAAYALEADRLAAVAQSGDRATFDLQFKATAATCKACHDPYRVPQD